MADSIKEWFTQDPQPFPVILLMAVLLIFIVKPWYILLDYVTIYAEEEMKLAALAIILIGGYLSWHSDGWTHWFSWSPTGYGDHVHWVGQYLGMDVLSLKFMLGVVACVLVVIIGSHQEGVRSG